MSTHPLHSKIVFHEEERKKSRTTQKLSVRDRIMGALEYDIPSLPATTHKLLELIKQPDIYIETLAEVIKLDPGMTTKFLKVASSPLFGKKNITSLEEALQHIGLVETKKIATAIGMIHSFDHFRIRINWELFWLHSLFTAHLTESLAHAYRDIDGREYLAGLLHDIGKLFMEQYFPEEFELAVLRSVSAHSGMFEAENQLFDISHAEVSALLCEKWGLHKEIVRAVRYHHQPFDPHNKDPDDLKFQTFLALCVCLANKIANICHANIQGAEDLDNIEFTSLSEWQRLKSEYIPQHTLILDVAAELEKVEHIIAAVKAPHRSY